MAANARAEVVVNSDGFKKFIVAFAVPAMAVSTAVSTLSAALIRGRTLAYDDDKLRTLIPYLRFGEDSFKEWRSLRRMEWKF